MCAEWKRTTARRGRVRPVLPPARARGHPLSIRRPQAPMSQHVSTCGQTAVNAVKIRPRSGFAPCGQPAAARSGPLSIPGES